MEEAKALLVIRERRLYRETHSNFLKYTSERWGHEHSHTIRLCQWAQVLENLAPIGVTPPERESHARPLFGLTADQQRMVWRRVEKRLGDTRTAVAIDEMVTDHLRTSMPQKANQRAYRGTGEIVVGDAIEQVCKLAKGSVGLCLFSPPYAQQRSDLYPGIAEKDFPSWMARLMFALLPAMAPTGNIIFIGREHIKGGVITDMWLRTRLALREAGLCEIDTLIWHKPDCAPLGRADRPRRVYEFIYWFAATNKPYIDTRACGNPMVESRRRTRRDKDKYAGDHGRQIFGRFFNPVARSTDLITACNGRIESGVSHPAMFPVALADHLIRTFSRPNDLVVDCCCGSGSTLVAARDAGRNWWGNDVVPAYVREARRRLA
jgi:site-specific DNA-methyltransferase (adenine-specific)